MRKARQELDVYAQILADPREAESFVKLYRPQNRYIMTLLFAPIAASK
jgi:hypothetical protein